MGNSTKWFEVAAKDRESMKTFYSGLFEWKLTDMEGVPYSVLQDAGDGIPGGIGQAGEGESGHVTFYVEVDDVEASLAKAESLGGSRVLAPTPIPTGEIGLFADPEGHVVGVMHLNGSA